MRDHLSKRAPRPRRRGGSQHDHHEDGPEGETGPPTKRTQAKRGAPRQKGRGTPIPTQQTDEQTDLTQV